MNDSISNAAGYTTKVLLTGSNGFLGQGLSRKLNNRQNIRVRNAVRRLEGKGDVDKVAIGDIGGDTQWTSALYGIDVVIHAAARAHIMDDEEADPLSAFRRVNVAGTLNLARQAAEAGVRRFIFISSIKVNGEHTAAGQCFKADDFPAPEDPYGVSKMEAEKGLQRVASETNIEVVIIRPPLIYGPGVKGNFANMVRLVAKGLPLPLGAVDNKRSLIALDNLADLIITCIDHPAATNQIFLASDGDDLSTSELLRRVGRAMGAPVRLVPVPGWVLRIGAAVLGKKGMAQRLLGSLQVDISKTRELLRWEPSVSVDEGLRRCFKTSQDG